MSEGNFKEAMRFQREHESAERRARAADDDAARLEVWMRFWSRWHVCRYSRAHEHIRIIACMRLGDHCEPYVRVDLGGPEGVQPEGGCKLESLYYQWLLADGDDVAERAEVLRSCLDYTAGRVELGLQLLEKARASDKEDVDE